MHLGMLSLLETLLYSEAHVGTCNIIPTNAKMAAGC